MAGRLIGPRIQFVGAAFIVPTIRLACWIRPKIVRLDRPKEWGKFVVLIAFRPELDTLRRPMISLDNMPCGCCPYVAQKLISGLQLNGNHAKPLKRLARLGGETSNSLFETLEDWNIHLESVKSDLQKPALLGLSGSGSDQH